MSTEKSQTAPLLEVQQISKHFGNVVALQDISMSVRAGEVTRSPSTITMSLGRRVRGR